eukprot:PhF_6_TR4387/c0_g1_i2/m.5923
MEAIPSNAHDHVEKLIMEASMTHDKYLNGLASLPELRKLMSLTDEAIRTDPVRDKRYTKIQHQWTTIIRPNLNSAQRTKYKQDNQKIAQAGLEGDCSSSPQRRQQQQQQLLMNHIPYDEAQEQQRLRAEYQELARSTAEIREIQSEFGDVLAQQQPALDDTTTAAHNTNVEVTKGLMELNKASKLKLMAAGIMGAVVGGVVGGPIGFAAGATGGTALVGCVAAGAATGGIATHLVNKSIQKGNDDAVEMVTK